jgi:hypothetical protein
MARGWESKSVEEQQAEAAESRVKAGPLLTPEQIARRRQKEGLLLSRKRVLQQLEATQNPVHREMLRGALSDLDAKLAKMD